VDFTALYASKYNNSWIARKLWRERDLNDSSAWLDRIFRSAWFPTRVQQRN
jgi:hypothetical protein